MSTVAKNIKQRRLELGMSQEKLAELLGYKSRSTIAKIETGKAELSESKIVEFAKILQTTPTQLMGWIVEKEKIVEENTIVNIYNKLTQPRQVKVVNYAKEQLEEQESEEIDDEIYYNYIPVYGYASAGTGNYVEDTPIETIRVKGYVPKHDIALWVSGDSMEPMFRDKDIIYINKTKDLFNGQIGVFILDGESYIKKIRIEDNGIRLVSLNKKYKDIIIKEYSDLHIIGRVII